jgi:hypothetical protein
LLHKSGDYLQACKPSRLERRKKKGTLEGSKVAFLIIFLLIPQLFAQDLITDRPDQTESAVTVPLNSLQIETGFVYESFKEDNINVDNYSIAGTLLRYGLLDNIELRFGIGYLISKVDETVNGLGNFLLGAKINFLTEDKNSMDLGLLIHGRLPIGDEAFNPQKVEPELIAALSKSLSDRFSISVNIGGSHDSLIEEIIYLYTAALGYSASDNIGAFIEVYGNLSSPFPPEHLYDGGIAYLLSDNVQLDLSGGKKFTGDDSIWFVSSGISLRLL